MIPAAALGGNLPCEGHVLSITTSPGSVLTEGNHLTSTTYPDGRVVETTYSDSCSSVNNLTSRPQGIRNSGAANPFAEYDYLGSGQVEGNRHPMYMAPMRLRHGGLGDADYPSLSALGQRIDHRGEC